MQSSAAIFVVCLLVFGALNTLATKLTFQLKALDLNGNLEAFQKPWFGVYRMFQGMAFVMAFHIFNEVSNALKRRKANSKTGNAVEDLNGEAPIPPATPLKAYFMVALPAALDLLGTVCTYVGLFYNSPSVWQMFRGAMIIFATFFSVTFLKRKMSKLKWMGVLMCVFAIVLVGCANFLSGDAQVQKVDPNLKIFGMGMILVGMFLQGGQIVVEEFFMKGINIPPMCIVGMEGVWGCIFMFAIIFPIVQRLPGDDVGGCQENLDNDFAMLNNSAILQKVVAVYLVSVFTFNISGMMVTYALSAVHRTMIEASRTAVIWSIDLAIHHYWPTSPYGEVWNQWSFLQLMGFVLLVLGQATYSELLTWGTGASWRTADSLAQPLMSPVREPGEMIMSPAKSPWSAGSSMNSPKGFMDMPVDLPEAPQVAMVGLEDDSKA